MSLFFVARLGNACVLSIVDSCGPVALVVETDVILRQTFMCDTSLSRRLRADVRVGGVYGMRELFRF